MDLDMDLDMERGEAPDIRYTDYCGMTDTQYKGMLLDLLEDWKEVWKLGREAQARKVVQKAEQQIAKINKKLAY